MAQLTLDAKSVERVLTPLLAQYTHRVRTSVDAHQSAVSVATPLGEFTFKLSCRQNEPSNRLRFALSCPFAVRFVLPFKRGSIMRQHPFIETLELDECVINLDKLDTGGYRFSDWIAVKNIHVPGASGAFCELEFGLKEKE